MKSLGALLSLAAALTATHAFTITTTPTTRRSTALAAGGADAPPLRRNPPRKVCLMVEPTPFTHVSGYANRFKEMLKFMHKAGDNVDILTVDEKTASEKLPSHFLKFPIRHTQGFTFPLYNHISLTFDLPELKGARIIEDFKPDLIHVTSPGFLLFAAIFYARVMCIPLVMSYHTHLPTYGTFENICCVAVLVVTCKRSFLFLYSIFLSSFQQGRTT
jgi:glycosyltransferase involved in cell wall biosynthesis